MTGKKLTCITRRTIGAGHDSILVPGNAWCPAGILGTLIWVPQRSKYKFSPSRSEFDPVYTNDKDAFLMYDRYLGATPNNDFVLLAKSLKRDRVVYLVSPTDVSWDLRKAPWRFESVGEASYWARNNIPENELDRVLLIKSERLYYEQSS